MSIQGLGLGLHKSLATRGSLIGATLLASEYSIDFDGSGDYLAFTETTFPLGDQGDTLSFVFWAKRDGTGSEDAVICNVNGFKRRIHFNDDGDRLYIEGDQNGQDAYGAVTSDTDWHHYAITIHNDDTAGNPATVVMYEDGNPVSTTTTNLGVAAGASDGDFTVNSIGSPSGGGTTGFDGHLYQVAIFSVVLSPDNITKIYNEGNPLPLKEDDGDYNQSTNLMHLWRFAEGSGTDSVDSIGDLDLSLNGNAAFSTDIPEA